MKKLSNRDLHRLARILLEEYGKAIDRNVEKLITQSSVANSMEESRVEGDGPAGI